jgi:hypothetical protein
MVVISATCLGSAMDTQEVELEERRSSNEPVVFLVQVVEDDRVGQDLVQELTAERSGLVAQRDRKQPHLTEPLDLLSVLMEERLAALLLSVALGGERIGMSSVRHGTSPLVGGRPSLVHMPG